MKFFMNKFTEAENHANKMCFQIGFFIFLQENAIIPAFYPLVHKVFFMILQGVQLVVAAFLLQKLLVAALLQNLSLGQHDDIIRVLGI